jgi:hypothetical protein
MIGIGMPISQSNTERIPLLHLLSFSVNDLAELFVPVAF